MPVLSKPVQPAAPTLRHQRNRNPSAKAAATAAATPRPRRKPVKKASTTAPPSRIMGMSQPVESDVDDSDHDSHYAPSIVSIYIQ